MCGERAHYGFSGFQEFNSVEGSCNPPASPSTIAPGKWPCINTDKRVTEQGATHWVNLTYQIDPDRMVYGTYSTGFRPGGNSRRVRFNGAVFLEQWDRVQIGVQGDHGITSILNAVAPRPL